MKQKVLFPINETKTFTILLLFSNSMSQIPAVQTTRPHLAVTILAGIPSQTGVCDPHGL
jgi:hypothetical protein